MGIMDKIAFWRAKGGEEEQTGMKLKQVKWGETVGKDYEVVKEKLVWAGGAERVVEHCPQNSMYPEEYVDVQGYTIFETHQWPAYTEVLDRWTETLESNNTHYAWVSGETPPNTEETGREKMAYVD